MKNYNLKKNGFTIVDIKKNDLKRLRKNWISIFNKISEIKLKKKIINDKDIIKLYNSSNRDIWVSVYNLLHLDILLYKIASSKQIINLCKKSGIKKPHFGTRPYVRVDMPNDLKFSKFRAHQDFPYNNHSENSVVIWIPLQDTDLKLGCLQVSDKSHRGHIIYKYDKKNKIIKNPEKFKFTNIPCKLGKAIIFSQFLVHESGDNVSNKIRFSVQFRVTDLNSKEYAKRNYPVVR